MVVYACGPKTVPVKRTFLNIAIVGWGGVGWGGMLTFLVLRTWYIAMLLRSLGLFTATLLRSLVSFTTLHTCCYAAEISGIVYYVTYMLLRCWDLWYRLLRYIITYMLLRCWDLWDRLLRYMLLRCWDLWYRLLRYMLLRCWDLWDRLLRYMSLRCWDLWDRLLRYIHVATLLRSLRAWQWRCIHKNADCQLFTTHALQRWRWKTKKRAPSFSRISNHQISTALW